MTVGCHSDDRETIGGNMPTKPTITFDGSAYQLKAASFDAWLTTPSFRSVYGEDERKWIYWSIEIETERRHDSDEHPNLGLDGLVFQVRDWRALEGKELAWSGPVNSETDFRYGMIYFYDHQLVPNGQVRFLGRDGVTFYLDVRAENEEGQEFTYTGPIDFSGITVKGTESDSESTVRDYLEELIDTASLSGGDFELDWKYEDRIEMGEAVFMPRLE